MVLFKKNESANIILAICPECGSKYKAKPESIDDRKIRIFCKKCKAKFVIDNPNIYGIVDEDKPSISEKDFMISSNDMNGDTFDSSKKKSIAQKLGEPITKFLNEMLLEAVEKNVLNIYIEPTNQSLRIRFRTEETVYIYHEISLQQKQEIIKSIKKLSSLDLLVTLHPQHNGKFSFEYKTQSITFFVHTLPTRHGESINISRYQYAVSTGYLEEIEDSFNVNEIIKTIDNKTGLIIFCGFPYQYTHYLFWYSVDNFGKVGRKVISLEESMDNYVTTFVDVITFEPNVDFNDVKAANYSYIYKPDLLVAPNMFKSKELQRTIWDMAGPFVSVATITSFQDMVSTILSFLNNGVPDYLIASSISSFITLRHYKKICSSCRVGYEPAESILLKYGLKNESQIVFFKGRGCDRCNGTGFDGMVPFVDIYMTDRRFKEAIYNISVKNNLSTALCLLMRENYLKNVRQLLIDGVTTIEEIEKYL